ncbi:MAG TPA: cupin domain-containing protein [Burkholderiales bacterium]|nr:cupin domain-containing protein [Burkholderiales bacterium]
MGFHRFEDYASHHFNPHLSATRGPVIEGEYMYFRRVTKPAGSASRLHYHPNEFMVFLLQGRVHAIVGTGGRIVTPGTLIHIPSNARHRFNAKADLDYLYLKDRTWTLIGAAADEPLPEEALSATQVARALEAGRYPGAAKEPSRSKAISEGLGNCYYPMIGRLDAPPASAHAERWTEGAHLAFGFVESPEGHVVEQQASPHDIFAYVISGSLQAEVGGKRRLARVRRCNPRGSRKRLPVARGAGTGALRTRTVHRAPASRNCQERRVRQLARLESAGIDE